VDQPVQLFCGLAGEALPDVAIGTDLFEPSIGGLLVGEGPRPDQRDPGQRERGGGGLTTERLRLPPAQFRAGARRAERADDQDVGIRRLLSVGPQQVAAVTGSQPAGQIELGERE
jgi:hypothetical protein